MLPRRAVCLSLLFAISATTSLLAQSADLRVTLAFSVAYARAAQPLFYYARVENAGPDPASGVELSASTNIGGPECRQLFPQPLLPGQSYSLTCFTVPPATITTAAMTAQVVSATADPDSSNNRANRSIAVLTNPDLSVFLSVPLNLEPGLPFVISLLYANFGGGSADNTQFSFWLPNGVTAKTLPAQCRSDFQQHVICDLGTLTAQTSWDQSRQIAMTLVAPDTRGGGLLPFTADASSSQPDLEPANNHNAVTVNLYRALVVENTSDSGPGSLRQAITDANAQCTTPCEVQFRIDPAGQRWVTIRPRSPLPVVIAENLLIDGTTQTRFRGDTNPAGPEVEINGSQQADGDGLVIESSCDAMVRSLVLNGFPGSAIRIHTSKSCLEPRSVVRTVSDNYIGTDPAGLTAVPNLRGITIRNEESGSYPFTAPFHVEKNVISGNVRSALYVDSSNAAIAGNTIGLDAGRKAPLPNGASGIFVSKNATNTDISENAIAFNHEFGIGIERGARLTEIHGNSIHANWQPGIDIGLDGPTAATDDPAAPSGLTAYYDPGTDTTIIEGTSTHAEGTFQPIIRIFANDAPDRSGFGQGQYFLGATRPLSATAGVSHFTFTWPGDLRGKFIAATATRVNYYGWLRVGDLRPDDSQQGFELQTSEFSQTVAVK